MANLKPVSDFTLLKEGGWSNNPNDKGKETKYGITLANWKIYGYDKDGDGDVDVDDLKIITKTDYEKFFKKLYWNRWRADEITSQGLAHMLVDWTYNSGSWGVKMPQALMGIEFDGKVGVETLKALNHQDEFEFLDRLYKARQQFYYHLVISNRSQEVFLKGWLNRIKSIYNLYV